LHGDGSDERDLVHVHGDCDECFGYWYGFDCEFGCGSVDGAGCADGCVGYWWWEWSVGGVMDCTGEQWWCCDQFVRCVLDGCVRGFVDQSVVDNEF
jgi:hypothetical protein